MSVHIAILSSLLAIGGTSASPVESKRGRRHLTANLRRNSLAHRQAAAALQGSSQPLTFDASLARMEIQGLVSKYSKAADFLNGIDLNADTHPAAGYGAFNDTPINAYFQNTTKASLISQLPQLAARAADVEPIIGLPNGSYASFDIAPLTDDVVAGMDMAYYGPLRFGTPAQELAVSVDTGSADLWVPVACPGCSNAQFDAAASSTYRNTGRRVSVTYGAGRVVGTVAQDTVAVGALSVGAQSFVAVRSESQDFMDYASSGLVGLAFGSISRTGAPTFFESLLAEHKLAAGIFSTHLTRGAADGSEICFGCYDLTKTTGPIQWHSLVTKASKSLFPPPAVLTHPHADILDDRHGRPRGGQSTHGPAIDTGSSLVLVADTIAQQLYALIPGAQDASAEYGSGFYTYPCATPAAVALVLAGLPFAIHEDDFNLGRLSEDSDDCVGGVVGVSSDYGLPANLPLLTAFIGYVTFDYAGSRIGLAPSINNRR
ncbi:hypothetical protein PHLGIDRAFT_489683 [Phlebiopsis gigantea 11061_1 CR5-6]|uniref:Peptidase A1 domain-containing protein n=1 Tax=Phlebiopsis gigantea (strain 11061_1 CR5-6) TaxID=745531 RepID=A0A0C3S8S6_PHLG1|nr:hypothetical protein PHLGIDRAFT_489683 [Phlebiopsis gigantea 11061_1 CR5-6]